MEIKTLPERPALTIRTTTSLRDLPAAIGKAYGAIAAYLGQIGQAPAGAPFIIYRNMDMERLDIEAGFPTAGRVEGRGDILASTLPGGKVASTVHQGPYDTLRTAYEALTAFVKEQGLAPESWMYESYLNDPQVTAPDKLLTEIVFPLAG